MLTKEKIQYQKLKEARVRAGISVFLNLALAAAKAAAGITANSAALLSDAVHSGTDVLASGIAYAGLWLAGKRHPSFPYGLYKAETLATLFISMVIMITAYEIARSAFFGPERMPDARLGIIVSACTLAVSFSFGFFQLREGKRLNSPALVADARDYLTDSLSTAAVLAGFIGIKLGYSLDKWMAIVVSIFIFKVGVSLMVMAVKDLMDAAVDRETERKIIKFVESHARVSGVERVLSRMAGGRFIIDMDIVLKTPSHKIADRVSDDLEETILERFPNVVMARLRPHFGRTRNIRKIIPVSEPEGSMVEKISMAPWFLIETIDTHTNEVINREYIENPHAGAERKRGFLVGKFLLSLKPDQLQVKEKKEGTAVALLEEAGVEIV